MKHLVKIDSKDKGSSYFKLSKRRILLFKMISLFLLFIILALGGYFISDEWLKVNPNEKNAAPSFKHLFGTDWLGRDMLIRTLKGLNLSFQIGVLSAIFSALIALALSMLSSISKIFDFFITWLIDLFLSIPHLVTLILIIFILGGGIKSIILAIALTHWPTLTRVLRAEIKQVQTAEYVQVSKKLGKSKFWVFKNHYFPHIFPQLFVGMLLLFPHAILHESAITFLGFGLSPDEPAIGVILAESMVYLSRGFWWLAFFPGLLLVMMVSLFDALGNNVNRYFNPNE